MGRAGLPRAALLWLAYADRLPLSLPPRELPKLESNDS